MNNNTPVQNSLAELLRRSEVTSKARYNAGRRMELHNAFSQWTLAFLAVGQIVIALIVALKLKTVFSPAYVDFGGIFFGILVLAYSLLLGMGNYAARAIKHHACGMELGGLARSLHLKSKNPASTQDDYEKAAAKYYEILSKYENHIDIDYLTAAHEIATKDKIDFLSTQFFKQVFEILKNRISVLWGKFLQFAHYIASIFLISFWIFKSIGLSFFKI
jgi:SMODS and SLOG-associating 2TM effector domain family 5